MPLVAIWTPLGVYIGISCVALDEFAAGANVLTHEHGEDAVSLGGVLDVDLLEQTVLRIHGCLPELLGIHLTQTFVALCDDVLLQASAILVDKALALNVVIAELLDLTLGAEVERRGSYVAQE